MSNVKTDMINHDLAMKEVKRMRCSSLGILLFVCSVALSGRFFMCLDL